MLIIFFINLFFSSIVLAQSTPFYFQEATYCHKHEVHMHCSERKKHAPVRKTLFRELGKYSPFFHPNIKNTPPIFILYTKQNIYVLSVAYSSTNLFNKLSIWNVLLLDKTSGELHFMHQIFGPQCTAYDQKIKEYTNEFDIQSHIEYVEYIKNLFDENNLSSLQQEFKDVFLQEKKIRENIGSNEYEYRERINEMWGPIQYFFLQNDPQNCSIPHTTKVDKSNHMFSPFCWKENSISIIKLDNIIKTFLMCNRRLCDDVLVSIVNFLLPINNAIFNCHVTSVESLENEEQLEISLQRMRDFFCFYRYE